MVSWGGGGGGGGGGGAYEFREHETIRDKSNGKQKTERTFDSLLIDPF